MATTARVRKRFLVGLLFVIAASAILGTVLYQYQSKASERVRVGLATWPGFAVGFVGKEKHLFPNLDVQFQIIDDISARHAAFSSGNIDIMISSVDGFVQEYAQGLRGKIILITDESFGGDGLVAKQSIKSIGGLKGNKVAFARATPSQFLLYKILQKAGLKINDIQQAPVDDPGNAAQAFLGGSVDAAVTWEPFLTEVTESGKGIVLATSRDFPGTIVDVLVASPKMLENHQALSALVRGWVQSVQYTQQYPTESIDIIARGLHMKTEEAAGTMSGLRLASASTNESYLCGQSQNALVEVIISASALWKDQNIITEKPAPADLISSLACKTLHAN